MPEIRRFSGAQLGGGEENRNLIIGFCHTAKNPTIRGKSGICSFYLSAGCGVL